MNTVYMNPRAQDRTVVRHLFGHHAGNRNAHSWRPNAALVYDFYELLTAADIDRAIQHCNLYPNSVIVVNLSHESMPVNIDQAAEYTVLQKIYQGTDPKQFVIISCQQDTINSVQSHFPGAGTMYANYWETHVYYNQPSKIQATRTHRLGSFNRRYTAPRALFLYHMRNCLHTMLYTFGERGYWDDKPATVHQGEELKILRSWDPDLAEHVSNWQNTHRPWRILPNTPIDDFDDSELYCLTASADHWAVIESRAHNLRLHSAFLTEKTFRAIAVGSAVYPITEGDTDATLRSMGYEPYWISSRGMPTERIFALAQHFEYIAQLNDQEYQHYQQHIQELVQHNLKNFQRRVSTEYRRSTAPDRLKPYFG